MDFWGYRGRSLPRSDLQTDLPYTRGRPAKSNPYTSKRGACLPSRELGWWFANGSPFANPEREIETREPGMCILIGAIGKFPIEM